MSGMLKLDSSRCLKITAEFKFEKKQIQTVKMAVCSHLNFSSNFGGFSRRFFIRTGFFNLNPKRKTPPGVPVRVPVRALVIIYIVERKRRRKGPKTW
jgi:hypothetical protein